MNQISQSSNANANTPNAGAASLVPPAKLSTPRRINRTSPSSSDDILSSRLAESSSTDDADDTPMEKDDGSGASPSSSSSSELSSCTNCNDCENPMTLRRCLLCRRLRCRFMVIDCREMSSVASPANVTKKSAKCRHMSRMEMMALCNATVCEGGLVRMRTAVGVGEMLVVHLDAINSGSEFCLC